MVKTTRKVATNTLHPKSTWLTPAFEKKVEAWVKKEAANLQGVAIAKTFLRASLFKVWNKIGDYKKMLPCIPKELRTPEYQTKLLHYVQFRSGLLFGEPLNIAN